MRGLFKTLDEVTKFHGEAIIIANPEFGNFESGRNSIAEEIVKKYPDCENISLGLLLKENMSVCDIESNLKSSEKNVNCLIHAGFSDARVLVELLGEDLGRFRHLFLEN